MTSFLLFLLPLSILIPLFISLAVFRLWFPKHILKVSQAALLPAGICVFLISNIIQIYYLTRWLPLGCFENWTLFFENLSAQFGNQSPLRFALAALFSLSFIVVPAILTAIISFLLRKAWEIAIANSESDSLVKSLGEKVGETFFNFMGQLTAYNPNTEELIVDVYTSDNYLFCGIYSDYFIDSDGKLVGVSITNAIRHRITYNDDGNRIGPDSYIIPNQGEIFFPVEKVNNFHIWRMKQGHVFETNLSKRHNAITAAWYIAVRFVSKIEVKVRFTGDSFQKDNVELFFDCLEHLRIVPDESWLEFDKPETK